jgi:hypothetical protein
VKDRSPDRAARVIETGSLLDAPIVRALKGDELGTRRERPHEVKIEYD